MVQQSFNKYYYEAGLKSYHDWKPVKEFFDSALNGNFNESTTNEEIMEAVYDLVALRDAVLEAFGSPFEPSGHESAKGWTINKNVKSRNIMKDKLSKSPRGRELYNKYNKGNYLVGSKRVEKSRERLTRMKSKRGKV